MAHRLLSLKCPLPCVNNKNIIILVNRGHTFKSEICHKASIDNVELPYCKQTTFNKINKHVYIEL